VLPATAFVALAVALVLPPATASAKPVSRANLKALTNSIDRARHLGVLAYSGTASNYFKLTQYASNPSASLFSLPAGATTQSAP
jgi:hypothetical protein